MVGVYTLYNWGMKHRSDVMPLKACFFVHKLSPNRKCTVFVENVAFL